MKKEMYVTIPQPCHENWDAMTPQDKGRFCASCAKTVVDFSQMSDTQVLDYLSGSKGRLCGRFSQDQIERPLVPTKKEKKKVWWIAALMPLTMFLNKVNGQLTLAQKVKKDPGYFINMQLWNVMDSVKQQVNNEGSHNVNKTIVGTVLENDSIPLQGASVRIKGSNAGTVTDSAGNFELNCVSDSLSEKIIVNWIGYEPVEKEVYFNETNKADAGKLFMEATYTSGIVVTLGGVSVCRRVKKMDTVKTATRKILQSNPFKVYPNPVMRGAALHIEVKNEGHYSIQLLDVHSKLVSHSLFDAVEGATATSVIIPSSAAAGFYFIRLINDDTKQQYTDKIVVQ